jgi:hypothetical protein
VDCKKAKAKFIADKYILELIFPIIRSDDFWRVYWVSASTAEVCDKWSYDMFSMRDLKSNSKFKGLNGQERINPRMYLNRFLNNK